MILTVTLNPCIDKTLYVDKVEGGKFIHGNKAKCIGSGKGINAARLANTLGEEVHSLAILGGHTGRHVHDLIETRDGIKQIIVWIKEPTREILTVVDEVTLRQTVFFDPGPQVSELEKRRIERKLTEIIPDYDLVVLSGSVPCESLACIYYDLIITARNAGVKTILDTRGQALANGIQASPFMVKPNVAETEVIFGKPVRSDDDIWNAINLYQSAGEGIPLVVLSLGKRGAFVAFDDMRWEAMPPTVKEVNPVGSGDSLVGAMAVGLKRETPVEDTIRLGIAAGAANAQIWDAASCKREDIEELAPRVELRRL